MKFLDGKEQVIDIQLTSYGKYQLSKGKFRPHFYSFFDDGVLYDSEHGGFTEEQKDIQNRIKNETPRLETQSSYIGVETSIREQLSPTTSNVSAIQINEGLISSDESFQNEKERSYFLKYPIGTSDPTETAAPAWNVNFLRGAISSSVNYLTSSVGTLKVPQIVPNPIRYKTLVGRAQPTTIPDSAAAQYADGAYIEIIEDNGDIILDVSEINAFFGNNNFDVEVYMEEEKVENSETITTSTPLFFRKRKQLVKNNILLDQNTDQDASVLYSSLGILNDTNGSMGELAQVNLDASYVEYFLSLDFDNEIDDEVLCDLTVDHSEGVFSSRDLNCAPQRKKDLFDSEGVFNTDTTETDLEDC
jgi:uncharacterized protein with FMN-binding domain